MEMEIEMEMTETTESARMKIEPRALSSWKKVVALVQVDFRGEGWCRRTHIRQCS